MALLSLVLLASSVVAQKCSSSLQSSTGAPVVANGYTANVLVNRLTGPRGLIVDPAGNLLIVEKGRGISALKLKDEGGCVSAGAKTMVVSDSSLNHGIELSTDGKTLYASSADKVFSWPYDPNSAKTTGSASTLVTGMANSDHVSRTLLMSKKAKGQLLVSRGSAANIDNQAKNKASGHCQIRAFNVNGSPQTVPFATGGKLVAWGLRNSIGLAENPTDGGIWSNENGSDQLRRDGKDIHENSPGEEINFHGYLNGTGLGGNFGYPDCAAAWRVADIPRNQNLKVGTQFYIGTATSGVDDSMCGKGYISPRITLPSHWAPIDIKFNSQGTVAYMTAHGSWNRRAPDGYQLFAISFKNGQPVHPATSTTAALPILRNANLSRCPGGCFRPTGLAFDAKGRLYMASDRTGEIFVIGRTDGGSVDSATLETTYNAGAAVARAQAPIVKSRENGWGILWRMFGGLPGDQSL